MGKSSLGRVPLGLTTFRFRQFSPTGQFSRGLVPKPAQVRPNSVAERVPFQVLFKDCASSRRGADANGIPRKISWESCGSVCPTSVQEWWQEKIRKNVKSSLRGSLLPTCAVSRDTRWGSRVMIPTHRQATMHPRRDRARENQRPHVS